MTDFRPAIEALPQQASGDYLAAFIHTTLSVYGFSGADALKILASVERSYAPPKPGNASKEALDWLNKIRGR